jgi:hypothetical protein
MGYPGVRIKESRDWVRYAMALDYRLQGYTLEEVGRKLGVSRERARSIIFIATRTLANRVWGKGKWRWRYDDDPLIFPLKLVGKRKRAAHNVSRKRPRLGALINGTHIDICNQEANLRGD